jgi:hypothetical protein
MKEQLAARLKHNHDVLSISAIENPSPYSSLTDGFDLLLLVISGNQKTGNQLFHYIKDNKRIQEKWIDRESVERWILHGTNRNVIHWIVKGEIIFDRDMYLEGLRHRMLEFPPDWRDLRLLIEFSGFLCSYLQSKQYILENRLLDAYNNILKALHHWARIVIVESGIHPEITIWKQVKSINPGVYKLYEELTLSQETLKQRIQLVLLASEFSVMSKMEQCCKWLLDILTSKQEAWTLNELLHISQLQEIRAELPLLINRLVKKSLVKELAFADDRDESLLELRYTIA